MTNKSRVLLAEQGDDMVHDLLQDIIMRSYALGDSDKVSDALLFFLVRAANTWRSVRTLQKHTKDDEGFMVDAGTLFRAIYDVYLQAEYLVSDPSRSLERAHDYFDFEHVERYKAMKRILSANNWIAKQLQQSSMRSEGKQTNKQNYDSVKSRFQSKKGNVRNQWYAGNLQGIAEIAGKLDEYKIFLAAFNGCVHSSASAVRHGPLVQSKHALVMTSGIVAKIARLNVVHNKLALSPDYQKLLEVLCCSPDEESD